MRRKSIEFGDLIDEQLAQRIITMRLEKPHNSTYMKLGSLRVKLAAMGLSAHEWHIYVSCMCMEGCMVRKHISNATNSPNYARLPARGCCLRHPADASPKTCGLFYPPAAQYEGRREFDLGNYRPRPGLDSEQHHAVGQQAQIALTIADLGACCLLGSGEGTHGQR